MGGSRGGIGRSSSAGCSGRGVVRGGSNDEVGFVISIQCCDVGVTYKTQEEHDAHGKMLSSHVSCNQQPVYACAGDQEHHCAYAREQSIL